MRQSWDVVVVGLGAMGSAILCEVARRGLRVIGLDRHQPPHGLGSSHGATRIIREAYFEHPLYVPLVQRAYERWTALEHEVGNQLMVRTGGLMIGPPAGTLVGGARTSADRHGLAYDVLTGRELMREYPAFAGLEDATAIREARAGVLFPERCVEAHLALAARLGATISTGTNVETWRADRASVTVVGGGERHTAARLVLAPGAWMTLLTPELELPLTIERQVQHWFAPRSNSDRFAPTRFPVFLLEHQPDAMIYGFPQLPSMAPGVKVARHHHGRITGLDAVEREVSLAEVDAMAPLLARHLPDLVGGWLRSEVCLYTNTPDLDFLIDAHPEHPEVLLVSACSGHGFKFSSAIGEVVADLVTSGASAFDLTPFRYGRWG